MPPKKKQGKNGFFVFMMDFKGKQGRNFSSMQALSEEAGVHWNRMSKEQRRPFEEKALYERNNMKPGRYTSEGLDVEILEKNYKEERERIEEMKNDINQELKMASTTGRIQDKTFFIIHINTFCYCQAENRYYPAEIAVAQFSLENGVLPDCVFHQLIKPGVLPLGYASDAILRSKESHQIEPPRSDDTENNVEEVFSALKTYCQKKMQESKRQTVLYCDESHMKLIQQILDTWCVDYGDHKHFKVYNLQYMFRMLKNTVARDNVWPSDTFSGREIEKDVYAYAKGISCEYHDMTNVPIHCSRSIVVRYAYVICDTCCQDLDIEIVPGYHVPRTANANLSSGSSVISSRSSRSSRATRTTIREDDSDSVISYSSKSEWEHQSVVSDTQSSIILNDEEEYPLLGTARRNPMSSPGSWKGFSLGDNSSEFSQASGKSYAGATGTSGFTRRPAEMPSSVMNSMEKLSLNSSTKSSESFSLGHGTVKDFQNQVSDFPALGRARPSPFKSRVKRPDAQ